MNRYFTSANNDTSLHQLKAKRVRACVPDAFNPLLCTIIAIDSVNW